MEKMCTDLFEELNIQQQHVDGEVHDLLAKENGCPCNGDRTADGNAHTCTGHLGDQTNLAGRRHLVWKQQNHAGEVVEVVAPLQDVIDISEDDINMPGDLISDDGSMWPENIWLDDLDVDEKLADALDKVRLPLAVALMKEEPLESADSNLVGSLMYLMKKYGDDRKLNMYHRNVTYITACEPRPVVA